MSEILAFRVSYDLKARIKAYADELGLTESHAARSLIETGLGDRPEQVALRQASWEIHAKLRGRLDEVTKRMRRMLQQEMIEALELEGIQPGPKKRRRRR